MPALSVQNLTVSFGEKTLFENVSFEVEKKDKIGFVGNNGVGKTTLFRLLCGELSPDSGLVAMEKGLRLGYLHQHQELDPENDIFHELLSVFDHLKAMEKEIDEVNRAIDKGDGDLEALIARQESLLNAFENEGGLTYVSRTRSALSGLGFSEEEFKLSTAALSGGQRAKLSLSKLLLSRSDLLLLDEPTNHLDIRSISWLENFLIDFPGALIIISHDRYFLDRVTNKTVEIEHGKSMCYKGNYTTFKKKKEAILEAQRRKYENDLKEIKRIEGIIEQQRRWNRQKNIVTAESKQKEIDRIKRDMVKPDGELETMKLRFEPKLESGSEVLKLFQVKKSFGENELFHDVSLLLKKGERVFIFGENGCGKTTLMKLITKQLPVDEGTITYGASVTAGYFDQLQENLDLTKCAFDEIRDAFPQLNDTMIRTALARFLIKGDEVFRPMIHFSGGERARVSLLKLMLKGANLLLLDEPTNHLDAASLEALEQTLLDYTGTMLVISHDRYFINRLADRILVLTRDGLEEYLGNYDFYLEHQRISENEPTAAPPKKEKPLNEWAKRKQRASDERKRKTRLKKAEEQIEKLEAEKEEIETSLEDEATASDFERLMTLTSRLDEVTAQLDEAYREWEALSEEI